MRTFYDPKTLTSVTAVLEVAEAFSDFTAGRAQAKADAAAFRDKARLEEVASRREQVDLDREKRLKLARARAMLAAQGAGLSGANAISFLAQQRGEFAVRRQRLLSDSRTRQSIFRSQARNTLKFSKTRATTTLLRGLARAGKTAAPLFKKKPGEVGGQRTSRVDPSEIHF